MKKLFDNQKGISLLLTLFILAAVLTAGLVIYDLVIRQGRISQEIGFSEVAFYAGEAGIEKVLYEINKNKIENRESIENWDNRLLPNSKGKWSVEEIKENTETPFDPHFLNVGRIIDGHNPLEIRLKNTESFQLNLDLRVVNYPNELNFNWEGDSSIIIYSWLKIGGGEEVEIKDTPFKLSIDPDKYYKIRINNFSSGDIVYTLTPNGELPIGALIIVSGFHKDSLRRIEADNPRWQIY